MIVVGVLIISALLIALFVGVTIAGGRSHDRQNEAAGQKSEVLRPKESVLPSADRGEGSSHSIH